MYFPHRSHVTMHWQMKLKQILFNQFVPSGYFTYAARLVQERQTLPENGTVQPLLLFSSSIRVSLFSLPLGLSVCAFLALLLLGSKGLNGFFSLALSVAAETVNEITSRIQHCQQNKNSLWMWKAYKEIPEISSQETPPPKQSLMHTGGLRD